MSLLASIRSGVILQVSVTDVVALDEGALLVDDLVDTVVGVEGGLDGLEDGNGAVSTSTAAPRELSSAVCYRL